MREWLGRLPWWLLLVGRDLPESGDAYTSQMMLPAVFGGLSLVVPFLVIAIVPELRTFCGVMVTIAVGIIVYLVVGTLSFFAYEGKNFGPWQERGAW